MAFDFYYLTINRRGVVCRDQEGEKQAADLAHSVRIIR